MQLSQLSHYILSLRPIYLLGEYVGSLILFHLPENANVHLRQDGTFSKKFDLPVVICGMERLASCYQWRMSIVICGRSAPKWVVVGDISQICYSKSN
jgi:hypothetical protein